MKHTFRGGSHLPEHKESAACATIRLPEPPVVSVPLSQHIGAPATAVVQKGDSVTVGQEIGTVTNGLGCPVHASVSGTVKEIVIRHTAQGIPVPNIVIENDGLHTWHESVRPRNGTLADASAEEIVERIRSAGISGLGGATFPTYAKVQSAIGKASTVIINCAECEPYITANHRLLLERGNTVVEGLEILMHAVQAKEGILAVEDNKRDAICLLEQKIAQKSKIRLCVMKTKYPQGDERQILYALSKKEIPYGKLPADMGYLVVNAETASAVSRAFYRGIPLVSRIVTVAGDCIRTPMNVRAPLGTPYSELIRFCGGYIREPKKLISGGPMMGVAQWDPDGSVTKGTSALLAFSEERDAFNSYHGNCLHCGMCVKHCPMHLMPNYLASHAMAHRYDEAFRMHVMSCVECGTCTYHCPAGIPIVQYIRVAKNTLRNQQAQ